MKNFGKILAFVVVLSMLFTLVAFGEETDTTTTAPAETETAATEAPATIFSFSDVPETHYAYEAITVLSGLGVISGYPDGTFGPEKSITRAEFSAVIDRAKALGDSADAAKGATMFTDVAGEHWASGYINLASQQGIVNGMGDGTFAPDANVTFAQAVKMIVVALGYEPQAKSLGGWPSGYLAVAAQRGVTKNVASSKESEPATRAAVAKMLYNALDIPMMEQTGFGTDVAFEAGDKLLLDALDIIKVDGVVTATQYSADTGNASSTNKDKVGFTAKKQYVAYQGKLVTVNAGSTDTPSADIDDGEVDILAGETNAKNMLEYSVVAYIKSIDDEPEFAAIAPKSGKNTTLVIKSDDIRFDDDENTLIVNEDGTGTDLKEDTWDLVYYTDKDSGKDETVTIDAGASYYYNGSQGDNTRGKNNSEQTVEEIVKEGLANGTLAEIDGTVTLLNNDTDDNYDVVFITESKDYVVDEVYDKSYKISDTIYAGKSVIFDPTKKEYDFSFIKDGKPAKFEDIQKDDVLSIVGYVNSSKELEFGTVTIISNKVTGKVNELSTGEDDNTVKIGNTDYTFIDGVKLKMGDEGSFYANASGKIIAIDTQTTSANTKLAFVTKIAKSDGVDSNVKVRALTTAGEWTTFDVYDKINYRGESGKKTKDIWTETTPYILNKVVAYEVNSDNKITKFDDQPDSNSNDSNFYKEEIPSAVYNESSKKLTGESNSASVNDKTVLFNVPIDAYGSETEISSESDITVTNMSSLADEFGYGKVIVFNKVTDGKVAPLIVGSKFAGVIKYNNNFMVVTGKSSTSNDDSENVTKISGYQNGEQVWFYIDSGTDAKKYDFTAEGSDPAVGEDDATDDDVDAIDKGTVLLFSKDSKNNADKLVILFNSSDLVTDTDIKAETGETDVLLKSITESSKNNKFILGYAFEVDSSSYLLAVNANSASALVTDEYSFATTAKVYQYDGKFNQSKTRLIIADPGDLEVDTTHEETDVMDGDYIFARVNDDGDIADAVIIKHQN